MPLNIAHAKLMDQGIYIASLSTCERVMKSYYQSIGKAVDRIVERRKRPEYSATGPNQVWCWDITWLHSEVTGKYYYLYLIIDMFSRYIVGWSLHTKEDGKLAELLFAETIQKHCPGQKVSLLVHADNGKPMRSKDLKSLFEKLHVMSSHSRPHTSNDNAFAESIFATMKSRVVYPEYFMSIEDAERFVVEFVDWYNNEHLHSGLDLLPPCAVHFGYHQDILDRRNSLLEKARMLHPERFGGRIKFFRIDETVCLKHRIHLPKAG